MGAVRMVARTTLRHRVWGTVAVVLLVGISGGAVLAALSGARRTESAYDRMLRATHASDVDVSSGEGFYLFDADRVRALPHVRYVADLRGFGFALLDPNGVPDIEHSLFAGGSDDGVATYRRDRPVAITGRLPRPHRQHEVAVNEILARQLHVHVGDVLQTQLFDITDISDLTPETPIAEIRRHFTPFPIRIVGIGRLRADLLVNENQDAGGAFVSPEFVRRHRDMAAFNFLQVTLDHPGDARAFEVAMRREFTDSSVVFDTRTGNRATFARTIGPYRDALRLFALVAAIAGFLVVAQALLRMVALDARDGRTLFALGTTRAQRASTLAARAVIVAVAGAAIAAALAFAVSPIFPIGPARLAEPERGLRLDAVAMLLGAVVLALALLVPVAWSAWRSARAHRAADEVGTWRPSRLGKLIATARGPVSALSGVRFALERNRDRSASLPARVFGLVAAIAMIGAVLVFASNLDELVSTPQRFGWTWDAILDTYDNAISPDLLTEVRSDHDLRAVSVGTRGSLILGGEVVDVYGFDVLRGHAHPPVIAGRWPISVGEVALGAQTMRDLHLSVGSEVTARASDGAPARLRVVGRTVLPSLALNGAPGIAEGAAVTIDTLTALDPNVPASFFLADFAPGIRRSTIAHRYGDVAGVLGPQRPADILSYDKVQSTPAVLAGLLAILGVGVLTHLLVTSVRERRRELAVLKTIGFARRQVAGAVSAQASTVAAIALLVGVPLGVAAGRVVWRRFTDDLGVGDHLTLPLLALALVVIVTIVVANLVALGPAWSAARTRVATVLRAE